MYGYDVLFDLDFKLWVFYLGMYVDIEMLYIKEFGIKLLIFLILWNNFDFCFLFLLVYWLVCDL